MQNLKISNVCIDIGGNQYVIFSDDNYLEHIKNGFEPDMVKLFKTLATGSHIIIDIGANIGCTALLFSDLAEKVYAFEASQTTFQFLEKNILSSGKSNIFPKNYALGSETGHSTLTFAPSNRSGGFISDKTRVNTGHITETISVF